MARFDTSLLSRERLYELYVEQSLTALEIATQMGCGETTVFRALDQYKIPRRSKSDYRFAVSKEELERLYLIEGLSEYEIAERFDTSQRTISRRLIELGIPTRPTGSIAKWTVPSALLDSWSPQLAYVVGLIASDGNLNSDKIQVEFISTDTELIELYCRALQLDSIHVSYTEYQGRKPWYKVRLNDRNFRQFLERLGLTPVKSKTISALQIPDLFFVDFLRGVIDGDGSWYTTSHWLGRYTYLRMELGSASNNFIEWIDSKILTLAGLHGSKGTRSLRRYHYLTFVGQQAIALGNWLYYSPDVLALSRKRLIWEKFANRSNSRSKHE